MGVEYDWCLVDFEINQQKSKEFLKINPNGRIPALIDRDKNVTVAESGAILEYICEETGSKLLPSKEDDLQMHLNCKQWVSSVCVCVCVCVYFLSRPIEFCRFCWLDGCTT